MVDKDMVERIERVAKAFGVSKLRVHIDFRIYQDEDGGPSWSVYVAVPDKDRRKGDHHAHGTAATLDQAEQDLLDTLKPKPSRSRERSIEELHAKGLLTDAERDQILASIAKEGSS